MSIKRCDLCDITNNPMLSRNHIKATEFDSYPKYSNWVSSLLFFNRNGKTICSVCETMHKNTLRELNYEKEL